MLFYPCYYICRQSSRLYYFFCHLAQISINCLSKTPTTEINTKIYQIFATITKTPTPMVQSALPTICNNTGMFECMADYLFEKKKYTKMNVTEILLVDFYYLHMDLFFNNSLFIFFSRIFPVLKLNTILHLILLCFYK
jgi:hypothetical protein